MCTFKFQLTSHLNIVADTGHVPAPKCRHQCWGHRWVNWELCFWSKFSGSWEHLLSCNSSHWSLPQPYVHSGVGGETSARLPSKLANVESKKGHSGLERIRAVSRRAMCRVPLIYLESLQKAPAGSKFWLFPQLTPDDADPGTAHLHASWQAIKASATGHLAWAQSVEEGGWGDDTHWNWVTKATWSLRHWKDNNPSVGKRVLTSSATLETHWPVFFKLSCINPELSRLR